MGRRRIQFLDGLVTFRSHVDGRQSYEVIHKGGLMESETETENYKNISLLPSARLKEN